MDQVIEDVRIGLRRGRSVSRKLVGYAGLLLALAMSWEDGRAARGAAPDD